MSANRQSRSELHAAVKFGIPMRKPENWESSLILRDAPADPVRRTIGRAKGLAHATIRRKRGGPRLHEDIQTAGITVSGNSVSRDSPEVVVPRVLYLIKSARDNASRRAAQERSWLCDLPAGSEYFFCLGDTKLDAPLLEGRHLVLPVPDDYAHLPAKMKAMVAWASERRGFDYVVTMDDDVVVELRRLNAFLQNLPDHFGNRWNGDPSHISGMFVGYSCRAFEILAEVIKTIPDTGADDLLVSRAVHLPFAGLKVMTGGNRFTPYGGRITRATIAAETDPFHHASMRRSPFGRSVPRRRVSFCLYGSDPKYVRGAVENAELVRKHYPGWEAVFYTRDVSQSVLDELRSRGASVVECRYRNMMLARFLPCCEEGVVISRDCDSRITPREVRAVSEWLATDKAAHIIRDHPEHIPGWALIPGGLWGSRQPFDEGQRKALEDALDDPNYEGWGGDQRWLVERIWRLGGFKIHQYDQVAWMRESWKPDDFCGMRHEVREPDRQKGVVLFEGFFNRLNGLVNARLTHGPKFHARWAVNHHLPHRFEDLFGPSPEVEITNQNGLRHWPENTDPLKGPLCYWYVSRRCGAGAPQVEEAYRHFISRLKVTYEEHPPPLGIHFRGLHHSARVAPADFARWCLDQARARDITRCFAMADSGREEIRQIFEDGGLEIIWGSASPLDHDLNRRSLEELRKFVGDAITLAHCPTVLTSFDESTIVDPARAFGREVLAYSGSREWTECWFQHASQSRPPAPIEIDRLGPQAAGSMTPAGSREDPPLRILVADIFLTGRPHADWKEGYELSHAFRNLGHHCDVVGPGGAIPEHRIPEISDQYDLVVITENYPAASGWKWWDWAKVKAPKLFWAIDTHLVDYRNWIREAKINIVAFNNPEDQKRYRHGFSFFMTYAASRIHHAVECDGRFTRDLAFIGSVTPGRERLCRKFGAETLNAFGTEYVREMRQSRICLNQSISYDLNAKYFDILASGSFMLANYNDHFHEVMERRDDIGEMLYRTEEELGQKIRFYLSNEAERARLAATARAYILKNHTWENRAQLILENYRKFTSARGEGSHQLASGADGASRQSEPVTLDTAFAECLSRLEILRHSDHPQYLYGTHIEALHPILKALDPAPGEALLEIGGGDFSTCLLLSTGAHVLTLEQGQNVPPEVNAAWLTRLKENYSSFRNWRLLDCPGTEAWQQALLPVEILFCFVDGNGDCRKEIIDFMLARGVPVVAAHDSETKSFRYDQIAIPASHAAYDFKGREVWTRVWTADLRVTRALEAHPCFAPVLPLQIATEAVQSREQAPLLRSMKFFNVDFHISVIADIRSLLGELGHTVDSLSLSNHTWVFGREKDLVPGLDGMSTVTFGRAECDRFYARERDNLEAYDAFIVTHTPCLAGLYERTGKPVICVVSTRYDGFCHTPESRAWLDEMLLRMHGTGQLILLANNAYDAWHIERHLGIRPEIIPSFCDYTGAKWIAPLDLPFIHGKQAIAGLRRLAAGHTWQDVAAASCCVTIPYNASLMSMFERHTMGMPIAVPSRSWLLRNPGSMSELRYDQKFSTIEIEAASRLADWYSGELPGVTFFDDEHQLEEILRSGVPPVSGIESRKTRILASWRTVMKRVGSSPQETRERNHVRETLACPPAGFWHWKEGVVGELRPDGTLIQWREAHRELHFGTWGSTPCGMDLHLPGRWLKHVDLVGPNWGTWRFEGSAAAGGIMRRLGSAMPPSEERRTKLSGDTLKSLVGEDTFLIHSNSVLEWHRLCAPKRPYSLITSFSDTSIDSRFECILEDKNLRVWYSPNVGIRHPKLRPIPLGVCYRLALQEAPLPGGPTTPMAYDLLLDEMGGCRKTKDFLVSFTVETNPSERHSCLAACELPNKRQDRVSFLSDLGRSRYCLSPEGIGVDCHRVWEALYCRTVPIITRNLMVDLGMYDGLPVVVLERWEDFHASDYTVERYDCLMQGFNPSRLTWDRWITASSHSSVTPIDAEDGRIGRGLPPGSRFPKGHSGFQKTSGASSSKRRNRTKF